MYKDIQDSFCLKETKPCNTSKSRYYLTFIYFLPPALDSGPLHTLHNYTSISTITLVPPALRNQRNTKATLITGLLLCNHVSFTCQRKQVPWPKQRVYACIPSTRDTEVGGSIFAASLGYTVRSCSKTKRKQNNQPTTRCSNTTVQPVFCI